MFGPACHNHGLSHAAPWDLSHPFCTVCTRHATGLCTTSLLSNLKETHWWVVNIPWHIPKQCWTFTLWMWTFETKVEGASEHTLIDLCTANSLWNSMVCSKIILPIQCIWPALPSRHNLNVYTAVEEYCFAALGSMQANLLVHTIYKYAIYKLWKLPMCRNF